MPKPIRFFPDCKQRATWYNKFIMNTQIDISNIPDLLRMVKKVETTKTPLELKQGNKIVAILIPSSSKSKTTVQDALALAGAWKNIPSDNMEERLHQIRHQSKPTPPFTFED